MGNGVCLPIVMGMRGEGIGIKLFEMRGFIAEIFIIVVRWVYKRD